MLFTSFTRISVVGVPMITALFWVVAASMALAQPSVTNAGTLTCTVADVSNKPSAVVELSCNFKAQTGAASDYTGSANTKSGGLPTGKHVFVWSVVAVDAGKPPVLEGAFAAEVGRQGPAVLIGGRDGTIRLEPVTGKEQQASPSEFTTLYLRLASTKA